MDARRGNERLARQGVAPDVTFSRVHPPLVVRACHSQLHKARVVASTATPRRYSFSCNTIAVAIARDDASRHRDSSRSIDRSIVPAPSRVSRRASIVVHTTTTIAVVVVVERRARDARAPRARHKPGLTSRGRKDRHESRPFTTEGLEFPTPRVVSNHHSRRSFRGAPLGAVSVSVDAHPRTPPYKSHDWYYSTIVLLYPL